MRELYELKEKLMDNLEDYSKKEMTASNLEIVDKLSHTIKNLCKIIEDAEESEYSERGGSYANMGGGTAMGGSYARGRYSREGRGGSSYARGGRYSREGGSYADGRGRGSQANRDSMGRYSSNDGMVEELRDLMEDAPDEKTRMEFEKFIRKMESMG